MASIYIVKHLLYPEERRQLHDECVKQQFKSKLSFETIEKREEKLIEDLESLKLYQKSPSDFICRANKPEVLMRIQSRDFTELKTYLQISQKSDEQKQRETRLADKNKDDAEEFKIEKNQEAQKKFFLVSYSLNHQK